MRILGFPLVVALISVSVASARADPPPAEEAAIPVLESSHRPGLEPPARDQEAANFQYPRKPTTLPPPALTPAVPKDSDLMAGALHYGVLGALAGAAVGLLIERARFGEEDCPTCVRLSVREANTVVYGGAMGWALGSALGTHLASRGQGNLPLSLATSLSLGWAGATVALQTGREELFVPFLMVQFVATVHIERGTRGSRSE
jgi:hypothetical protein